MPDFASMMGMMGGMPGMGALGGGVPPVADPETTYAAQIQQLVDMGTTAATCTAGCVATPSVRWMVGMAWHRSAHVPILIAVLANAGFFDREANVRALQQTGGNVNAAVERLLSS